MKNLQSIPLGWEFALKLRSLPGGSDVWSAGLPFTGPACVLSLRASLATTTSQGECRGNQCSDGLCGTFQHWELDLPGFMTHSFSLAVSSYLLLHQSAKTCKPNFIEPLALSGEFSDLMSNPSATSLPWSWYTSCLVAQMSKLEHPWQYESYLEPPHTKGTKTEIILYKFFRTRNTDADFLD